MTLANNGACSAFVGIVVSEENDTCRVAEDLSDPGVSNFTKNSEVRYFDKKSFKSGDCVAIFNTRGKMLGIASQLEDYIHYFKYGE